jgi:uncharacterized protein (TIGR02217 family)
MAFHEMRFPDNISRGAKGGPERRTQVVTLASGDEERNASWANSRRHYDAAYGIRRADDLAAVIAFFEARNGRLYGFRWKDWADYKSCLPSAAVSAFDQPLGVGDGITTAFPLTKTYASGAQAWVRAITKPVAGTVQAGVVTLQGPELLTAGSNPRSNSWGNSGATGASGTATYGSFTNAYDLGLIGAGLRQHAAVPVQQKKYRVQAWIKAGTSLDARLNMRMQPGNLDSGIKGTYAAPAIFNQNGGAVSNVSATDLGSGFWLWAFDLVVGLGFTGALLGISNNNAGQIVTILGASLYEPVWTGPAPSWSVDTTTGVISFASPPSVGTILTCGFEFDVPVRFDTDDLPVTLDIERLGSITSIPLIEVRR